MPFFVLELILIVGLSSRKWFGCFICTFPYRMISWVHFSAHITDLLSLTLMFFILASTCFWDTYFENFPSSSSFLIAASIYFLFIISPTRAKIILKLQSFPKFYYCLDADSGLHINFGHQLIIFSYLIPAIVITFRCSWITEVQSYRRKKILSNDILCHCCLLSVTSSGVYPRAMCLLENLLSR